MVHLSSKICLSSQVFRCLSGFLGTDKSLLFLWDTINTKIITSIGNISLEGTCHNSLLANLTKRNVVLSVLCRKGPEFCAVCPVQDPPDAVKTVQ